MGEEAALCLKNLDGDRLLGASQTDGAGGFADLNPKVPLSAAFESKQSTKAKGSQLVL